VAVPITKWQPPAARHSVADDGRVTWLELFFDLVYVAALIQLGDRLSADVSWSGGLAFVGAFVLLWWTWTGTTAFTSRFAVDDIVHRLLTFLQMFAVGNLAIVAARTEDNWQTWLPLAYVAARLPLIVMHLRARARVPEGQQIAGFYAGFYTAGSALWLASLLLPADMRIWLWVVALVVEFTAPAIGARKSWGPTLHAEHFEERYALFTIIVLGETFVKSLTELTEIGTSTTTQVFGSLGFLMLVALWWTYFDDVAGGHVRPVSRLTSWPAGNRLIWVYVHLPLAAAITAFGVASKKVIGTEAFGDSLKDTYTWLLIVALVGVLLSVAVLDLVTSSPHFAVDAPTRVGPRLAAIVVLIPLGFLIASGTINALTGVALITAVVVVQIAVEVVFAQKTEAKVARMVQEGIDADVGDCEHLQAARVEARADAPVCSACAEHGVDWIQLRWCLTCGFVGCCDDSPAHAREHFEATGHPVMATLEPGDSWAYCWIHETSSPNWLDHHDPERISGNR
jgi:low temperature requirement protein LtrA